MTNFGKILCCFGVVSCVYSSVSFAQEAQGDIRGVVEARRQAELRAELNATVSSTPFRTGEKFEKGETLIQFDCRSQSADADAAKAVLTAAKTRHDSNLEMQTYGAVGNFDVKVSRAELAEADARLRAIRATLRRCRITAPYSGRVAELIVNAHEKPSADAPLIRIVGDGELELKLIVPSNWLVWLSPGTSFSFTVDETSETYQAEVIRIGAEVDAVSRTVVLLGKFASDVSKVLPGMSGTAHFKVPEVPM